MGIATITQGITTSHLRLYTPPSFQRERDCGLLWKTLTGKEGSHLTQIKHGQMESQRPRHFIRITLAIWQFGNSME